MISCLCGSDVRVQAITYFSTLTTVVAVNALALSGVLPFTTALSINSAIGGCFAAMNIISMITEIKNHPERAPFPAIMAIAALAIAASSLYFAHLLPMKAAAGIALGAILFPTPACICLFALISKDSKDQIPKWTQFDECSTLFSDETRVKIQGYRRHFNDLKSDKLFVEIVEENDHVLVRKNGQSFEVCTNERSALENALRNEGYIVYLPNDTDETIKERSGALAICNHEANREFDIAFGT